jgi:hypothetical protein
VTGKFLGLFIHDFIKMKTGAMALHQTVSGGKPPSYTLATWMEIEPMLSKPKGWGLTTRPGDLYLQGGQQYSFFLSTWCELSTLYCLLELGRKGRRESALSFFATNKRRILFFSPFKSCMWGPFFGFFSKIF